MLGPRSFVQRPVPHQSGRSLADSEREQYTPMLARGPSAGYLGVASQPEGLEEALGRDIKSEFERKPADVWRVLFALAITAVGVSLPATA